jgi:hypothetical protein
MTPQQKLLGSLELCKSHWVKKEVVMNGDEENG